VATDLRTQANLKGSTSMRTLIGSFALVALVSTASFAQPADKGASKVKVYDFSGDTIEGDLVKPDGTDLNARDFAKHSSLIKIRKDFIPEIIKSAEDL
jgi:hypothetical protein